MVGSGAKMPGLVDLAKRELRLPAQVGIPDVSNMEVVSGELALQIEDPEFACCLGLLMWGGDQPRSAHKSSRSFRGLTKKILNYFMP